MTLEYHDQQTLQEPYRSIGVVVGPRGMNGEIRVKPWDKHAPWIDTLQSIVLIAPGKVPRPVTIDQAQMQGDLVRIRLKEVTSRDEAELLKGMDVRALQADLPECGEDEFYIEELVGLSVQSQDSNRLIGTVKAVTSSNAGDFLEVQLDQSDKIVLIPFQDVFVPEVDLERGVVEVTGLDDFFE